MTPEQQFASDVSGFTTDVGGTVGSDVASGQITNADLGQLGDGICNDFTDAENIPNENMQEQYGVMVRVMQNPTILRLNQTITWGLSQSDGEKGVSDAINDICPTFQSIIPYGDSGAS